MAGPDEANLEPHTSHGRPWPALDRSHVFVMHGDLTRVHADGYIVPADHRLRATRWLPGLSDANHDLTWAEPIAARSSRLKPGYAGGRLIVVTDIAPGGHDFAYLLSGLDAALTEVEARWIDGVPGSRRERPMVAMPLVGAGRGGFRQVQGELVRRVLEHLSARVPDLSFDVVLVCHDLAQYSAAQHARRAFGLCLPALPEALEDEATDLARKASDGSLGVLFGAGVSMPLGLPNWKDLLEELARGTAAERLGDLSTLDPVDAAALILDELRALESEQDTFQARLAHHIQVKRHSLTHGLLASLKPTVAVTTNYDRGYELALDHVTGSQQAVMPWHRPEGAPGLRVVKLHGDIEYGSVVLSRDDFVLMHALRRPLTALLQEQMLAHHVLAVGTSMSDTTLVSAIAEASSLLRSIGAERPMGMGTLVMTQRDPARAALLGRAMRTYYADGPPWRATWPRESVATGPTLEPAAAARVTDLLLDRIAMLATRERNYLADPKFSDLIAHDQRLESVARRARELREAVDAADDDPTWSGIRRALDGLGATGTTPKDSSKEAQ